VEGGFYYDFDLPHSLSDDDFPAIEAEVARIIERDEPFERIELRRDKAIQVCRDLHQMYHVERIEEELTGRRLCPSASKESFSISAPARTCPAPAVWDSSSCFRSPACIGKAIRRESSCSDCTGPRFLPRRSTLRDLSGEAIIGDLEKNTWKILTTAPAAADTHKLGDLERMRRL